MEHIQDASTLSLEGLELQLTYLRSLLGTVAPYNQARIQELLQNIRYLERLHGQRLLEQRRLVNPPLPPISSSLNSPFSTLNSGSSFRHPHIGSSIMSPPQSRPLQPSTGSSNLPSAASRKRGLEVADLLAVPGPSAKRPGSRGSPVPTESSRSASSRRQSDTSDDEWFKILGLESRAEFDMYLNEQKEAEEAIARRNEEERRNAEFARSLQESLLPSPRPNSAQSISTNYSGSNVFNALRSEPPSPLGQGSSRSRVVPDFAPLSSQPSRSGGIPNSPFAPQIYQRNARPQLPSDAVISLLESDDSDVGEISAADYRSRTRHGPYFSTPNNMSPSRAHPGPQGIHPWPTAYTSLGPVIGRGLGPDTLYGPSVLDNTFARLRATGQRLDPLNEPVFSPYAGFPHNVAVESIPGYRGSYYDNEELRAVMKDTTKTSEEIKQLLETIRPDVEISRENREGTPDALRFPLLEHQKLGVSWMKTMEESEKKGGILADDMGLGKTIQALALMVSRPPTDPDRKPTLIVAPVALMQQWKREIRKMLKPHHQLSVYVLHSERNRAGYTDLKRYDVVLTTFGTLAAEYKRKVSYEEEERMGTRVRDVVFLQNDLPVLSPMSKWHRVIVDEAQCIKNRNAKAAHACCHINTTYRWCMSGTPMMNSVEELHSLIKFLRIRPYCELEKFTSVFTRPLKNPGTHLHRKAMQQLQVLLKAILLRRTKTSTVDRNPILRLPARVTEEVHAVFNEDEHEFYNALETQTQIQFNRYLNADAVGRNYSSILTLLLRLRQACCHPHLIKDFSVEINAHTNGLDLVANAKAFDEQVVIRVRNNNDSECPICMDAVDNPIIFFPCGHGTCAECFARISDPVVSVRQGVDGSQSPKCPNCRSNIDPKKITDNATFRKVHYPDPSNAQPEPETAREVENKDESDDESDDDLAGFIEKSDGNALRKERSKGKAPKKPKKTLAELKKEGMRNQKAKRKYLRRLEKTWISSAKIDKTMEILQRVQDETDGEKTIIFSQFTSLLDLLEVPISRKSWGYRRYDGSMRPAERNASVMQFADDPSCKIMLVSLKAGNSGLNLVAASQVIMFDPFWNPYVEEQAVDRAHRIGQMREVHVHRILVQETVEDRILELQEKKRELIEGALDENAGQRLSRLGTRELAYLFGVRH